MNDELKIVLGKLGYTNPSYDSINDLAHKYYIRFKEREKELPYWINLVEVMNLGYRGSGKNENGHSRFLYELFRYTYNETHPVINSFINRFTDRKGFKSKLGDNKITVNSTFSETGRHPDIYINQLGVYDSDETISVVFENKIDYAEDRKQQMEDYIKGMYMDRNHEKKDCDSNCYALYLIPDYASIKIKYDDHDDLGRQKIIDEEVLDKLIPDKNYILLSYKEDILPWLKNDLLFSLKEKYLIDNVNLYIQYLENKFKQREEVNNIKIESMNTVKRIEGLKLEELCTLQDGLTEYINNEKNKIINSFKAICENYDFKHDNDYDGILSDGYFYKLMPKFSIWCEISLSNGINFHVGLAIGDEQKEKKETQKINPQKMYEEYLRQTTSINTDELISFLKNHGLKDDTKSVYNYDYYVAYTFNEINNLDVFKKNIEKKLPEILRIFIRTYPKVSKKANKTI